MRGTDKAVPFRKKVWAFRGDAEKYCGLGFYGAAKIYLKRVVLLFSFFVSACYNRNANANIRLQIEWGEDDRYGLNGDRTRAKQGKVWNLSAVFVC